MENPIFRMENPLFRKDSVWKIHFSVRIPYGKLTFPVG
jgi:hypothetical protein